MCGKALGAGRRNGSFWTVKADDSVVQQVGRIEASMAPMKLLLVACKQQKVMGIRSSKSVKWCVLQNGLKVEKISSMQISSIQRRAASTECHGGNANQALQNSASGSSRCTRLLKSCAVLLNGICFHNISSACKYSCTVRYRSGGAGIISMIDSRVVN